MPDQFCVKHFDVRAVGNCGVCNKPYCADCLDVETGKPICSNCKQLKVKEALKAAVAGPGPSLNFKSAGMDDDPLGLLAAKPAAPKVEPPKPPMPPPVAKPLDPKEFLDPKSLGTHIPKPPVPPVTVLPPAVPSMPKPIMPGIPGGPMDLNDLAAPPKPVQSAPLQAPKPSLDLDAMNHGSQPMGLPLTKAGSLPPLTPVPTNSPTAMADIPPIPVKTQGVKKPSVVKIWVKYFFRRSLEIFEPLSAKTKVPAFVFPLLILVLLGGGVFGLLSITGRPSVRVVTVIQPIHFVQVNASQISDMDITSYTDIQNQLKTMGFNSILQATIPQLPSSNFFDVYSKDDSGTYAEILKMPGQITPHLSFVTVFSNGVWYSSNAWASKGTTGDYLVSESFPNSTPDQLYVQHIQGLEKLKQDKDWQVSAMGENRYMAALSDHLRWFIDKNNLQAYQADFVLWN